MKELVVYIAKNLVDKPEAVEVQEEVRGRQLHLRLNVDSDDTGRVIGRGGRVVNAMRSLLRVAAIKQGKRVQLEIR